MIDSAVWIIGDWRHADFSAAIDRLITRMPCVCFANAATALAGLPLASRLRDPAAIMLVQSRPGQIAKRDVEHLHAAAPLAQLVALVGPWCEGEMRSGDSWPGVMRIAWRAWQTRLPCELGLTGAVQLSLGRLPRTAAETERIEQSTAESMRARRLTGSAAICTSNRTTFESIADALGQFGIEAYWQMAGTLLRVPPAELVVFDGWEQVDATESPIELGKPASRLLLLDFPRPDDMTRAAAAGISAVLARPLLLADLSVALDDILPQRPETADGNALTVAGGGK